MAVYLDIASLIVSKQAVAANYTGGLAQFRLDHDTRDPEVFQEDDELFCLSQMNTDAFYIDLMTAKGLHYDTETQSSKDFTILERYGDFLWPTPWVEHNRVFAWHIHTSEAVRKRAEEIGEMHVEYIVERLKEGVRLLKTIRASDL